MGSITREEEGVLKLVCPGRRVEVHKEAITAEEVMKKYPRHCITRPDIFEFPWIVVKPEALLTPGKVFFIVPNRTIYQLLKAREHSDQPASSSSSSQQRHSAKDHGHHHPVLSEQTSPPNKGYAGATPKHQEKQRRKLKYQFMNFSCATVSPTDQVDPVRGHQSDSQVGSWPDLSSKKKATRRERKHKPQRPEKPQRYSTIEPRYGREYDYGTKDVTAKLAGLNIRKSKQVALLKSCLRKPESARKLLHLKVEFTLPHKDEEQQRKVTDSRMQFQGSLSR